MTSTLTTESESMAESCINMIRSRLSLKQCCLFNTKIEGARRLPKKDQLFMIFAICKATKTLILDNQK